MFKYTIKRLFQSLITVLLVVSAVFLLLRLLPTDFLFTEEQLIKLTEEQQQDILKAEGYLDHPFVQLGRFYKNLIQTEHKPHYFEKLYVIDDTTVEVVLKSDKDAKAVTASGIEFRMNTGKEGDNQVIHAVSASALNDPERPGVVVVKLDDAISLRKNYILTMGGHTGTFNAKSKGEERINAKGIDKAASIKDEATFDKKDYFKHMKVSLNFGNSRRVQTGVPVFKIIGEKIAISMKIGLAALAIALVIGVPLGIMQARFKDGIFDMVGQGYTIFINAVPHLVTYFLIMIIGNRLLGLPIQYSTTNPKSAILPMISLSMGSIASYMLWMRRYMVDELNKDYIRLAKLKGMSTTQVMFRHVMKNAFLPLAQYLPYSVLLTVGGSILVEKMFGVPGLGNLLPDAIAKYDANLVQAVVSLYATLGILGLFFGDVLMIILDPRIRLTGKGGTR